ncbi:MAG: DUF4105 domain-containing protein [Burkholderiaceae bacterium]
MHAILGFLPLRLIVSLTLLLSGAWGTLAIYFQGPFQSARPLLWLACTVWAVLSMAALVLLWTRQGPRALAAYALAFTVLYVWWLTIRPSDARNWEPEVSRHISAEIDGSTVTLHNVRNFDWRSETDYTERWETRRYDLNALRSVDMAVSYWMGPAIAHTLVSFGFDDGQGGTEHLVFSIEIRKERGEAFSTTGGFFKQFELSLVAADERDVLRVRTNARGEDVYLYRVAMGRDAARSLFLAYIGKAGALAAQPRFYHTVTANCTTIVYEMARRIVQGLPMDWRLLASGYLPEYLYRIGGLAGRGDLETLRAAGRVTERAKLADHDPQFSQAIRLGIPGMGTEAQP